MNGIIWETSALAQQIMENIAFKEVFINHDPAEDITTEVWFFGE